MINVLHLFPKSGGYLKSPREVYFKIQIDRLHLGVLIR